MPSQSRFISILGIFIIWQTLALLINSDTFPTAVDVFKSLAFHLSEGELLYHLGITLARVAITFFIAMVIGVFFGILMGSYKKIDTALDTLLIIGLNIPALVTIIICYIWFGLTDTAALLAVIINKVPTVIVTVREGARTVELKYMQIAQIYKVSKIDTLNKIFLPQIYPYIMASARTGLSLIWKIVLVVELLGRSSGIGFQLSMFFQFFDISSIMAYSSAFIIVILLIETYVLRPLEQKANQWR
ncbi:ABC transporter permease [Poseidonibacter ostreae]|jgi:NitT/TauT family transport system permease protein|uniref:ABC transporter permease subunit n=1 Tax=Poseidonibacter ostreae TaxID=2654171 RepID=A0A6L4WWD4_9BACT|nr:ABC transporter permease subunit [Poseidonibacter ostreae]KAB7888045.1 ABC transporter permease subunit [Poseidonibacter ostreae]KAB7891036.1 ABC transporter permease subunit [Poseidonibacter ostreae]KAB7892760.1 ABC transporter permease subunit [Poseidonibacter ostreae]